MILKIKKKKRERLEASRQAKNRAWCQGQRNFIALLDKGLQSRCILIEGEEQFLLSSSREVLLY